MKDLSWIYLLIFVVLPILKRVLESRSVAKRERSRQSTLQGSGRGASWPPSAAEDEDEFQTEAELEEEGWIAADPRPVASSRPPMPSEIRTLQELGGGWVEVPGVTSGDSTTTIHAPAAARPARLPLADQHGVPPHPIDLLDHLRQEMEQDGFGTDPEQDPYQVDDLESDPVHGPAAYSLAPSAQGHHGRFHHGRGQRLKLSRSELRDRLIWREILGPPACLREPE